MQGRSHIAVNTVSAVVVDSIFHTAGNVYSWHQLTAMLANSQLSSALHSPQLLYKLTYYGVIVLSARFPDVDQRPWVGRLTGGHRGCTHSCLGVLLLVFFLFDSVALGIPWLATHGLHLNSLLYGEVKVALTAIVIGWILHLLADSLTRQGIPILWPFRISFGFPPFSALRFKVGTIWEHMILWIIIFVVGFSLGTGVLGL